jgi:ectoine hydroxylase-related dioxygenase (phytanoyl-CoA dioxygenase family)
MDEHFDVTAASEQLNRQGYVILEGVLQPDMLRQLRSALDDLFQREREEPFDPGDGPSAPEDAEIETYLAGLYAISRAELDRMMRRIRHTRAQNFDTPWPVAPQKLNKTFIHIPNLFDHDRSQYVRNLPVKTELSYQLAEHPVVHGLACRMLGEDCVIGDISATSIGAQTTGGSWHLDNPLTQMPEPLPDFPLGIQVAWMVDDFTPQNGATRIMPRSHLTRRKPTWARGDQENEVALTAPAGSAAIWLGSTWHRAGPNSTERPRRAVISFYQCSWIKPFSEYRHVITAELAAQMSPTVRFLYGLSAYGVVRG